MALSGISQTTDTSASAYQPHTPVPTSVFTTDPTAVSSAPAIGKPAAAETSAPADTVDMSSIVANLGTSTAGAQTYNAAGLLNSAAQVSRAQLLQNTSVATDDVPAYEQDLTDLIVVDAHGDSDRVSDGSGIYTSSGDLQNLPIYAANVTGNGSIVNTLA